MKKINSLPSLPFRIIFSKLPPEDFVGFGQVCRLWKAEQETIASKYDTLTLLIGSDAGNLITESSFSFENQYRDKLINDDGITRMYPQNLGKTFRIELAVWDSCADFPQLFPNIATLEIAARNVVVHQLLHLLLNWAPQLQCLKMWFSDFSVNKFAKNSKKNQKFLPQKENSLLHTILNQLPVLEQFILDLGGQTCYPLEYGMDWPMLSRLAEFRVNFKDQDKLLDESLELYCSEVELVFSLLKFGFVKTVQEFEEEFKAKFPHLLPKVEMLHLTGFGKSFDFDQLDFLTSLTLQFSGSIEPFLSTINPLANLLQLKFLALLNMHSTYSHEEEVYPLKSVLVLKIEITVYYNQTGLEIRIPWGLVFPSVQMIEATFHFGGRLQRAAKNLMAILNRSFVPKTEEQIEYKLDQFIELICGQCTKLRLVHHYRTLSDDHPFCSNRCKSILNSVWRVTKYLGVKDEGDHGQRIAQKICSFDLDNINPFGKGHLYNAFY